MHANFEVWSEGSLNRL